MTRADRRDSISSISARRPLDLRLVGHELGQHASEANGFPAEVVPDESVARARGVALVEDEVDDREHRREPVGEVGLARNAVRDPGVADLALGADQALRHRRLGNEERARDLRGAEPAEEAQRERDLRARARATGDSR